MRSGENENSTFLAPSEFTGDITTIGHPWTMKNNSTANMEQPVKITKSDEENEPILNVDNLTMEIDENLDAENNKNIETELKSEDDDDSIEVEVNPSKRITRAMSKVLNSIRTPRKSSRPKKKTRKYFY